MDDESMDDELIAAPITHPFKVFRRPEYSGKKKAVKAEDKLDRCISYLQSAPEFCI